MRTIWREPEDAGVIWEDGDLGWNTEKDGGRGFRLARPHISRMPESYGPQRWCVWMPYTRPEHLDADRPTSQSDWQHIVDNAPVMGPYGDTFWDTWREAMDFLDAVIRAEPNLCPACRSNVRWEPSLPVEFLVCTGCSETLWAFELVDVDQPV